MTAHLSPVERELQTFIERLPLEEGVKTTLTESLQGYGFTEELAEEIRKLLSAASGEETSMERTRQLTNLTLLTRRLRLDRQKKVFKGR